MSPADSARPLAPLFVPVAVPVARLSSGPLRCVSFLPVVSGLYMVDADGTVWVYAPPTTHGKSNP